MSVETYDMFGDAMFIVGEITVQGPQQNIESYDLYGDAVFPAEITVTEEVLPPPPTPTPTVKPAGIPIWLVLLLLFLLLLVMFGGERRRG
ncbi:MAG: hypothetical protein QW794_08495 [Thermosphaera sp.]